MTTSNKNLRLLNSSPLASRRLLNATPVQKFAYGGVALPGAVWSLSKEDTALYDRLKNQDKSYEEQIAAYNKAVEEYNAGPRSTEFALQPPSAPYTQEQADALVSDIQKRADKQYKDRAFVLEVLANPKKYNLGIRSIFDNLPKRGMFKDGGEVSTGDFIAKFAKGSPDPEDVSRETTKAPEVTGMNRVVDFIAQKLNPEWFATSGRTLLETAQGVKTPITEKNFKPEELEIIRQLIALKPSDKGSITYGDYLALAQKLNKDGPPPTSITPGLYSMSDPLGNVHTTLGRFSYKTDPKGNVQIIDKYDFNPPPQQDMREARTGDYGVFGTPYNMIREYAGEKIPPGTGRDVLINLGPVTSKGRPVARFAEGSPNPDEVPSVDTRGQLVDEREEIRSESQRMLNRLKAQGPRSTGFGNLPPGVAALKRDIEQRQIDAARPGSAATMPLIDRPAMRIASDVVRGATSTTPVESTNPSEAYRLVQGLTNAYLPTAPVVRMGQSAKAAVQQPGATVASVKRGVEEIGDTAAAQLARLSEPNALGNQAGMVRTSKPESRIFSPTPSAQNPFVGRLDEYISTMPNKVQKDQFLNQLTGKFRDYEIQRAKDALEGLPGNASLTSSDLLNRIKGNYDPARFKTQVIEPDAQAHAEAVANNTQLPFYGSMDNPFPDRPMGVVHLIQEPSPVMASSKEQSNLIEDAYNATYRTYIQDGPEFEEFVQRIEAPFNKIPSFALFREEAQPLLQNIRKLAKRNVEVSDARDAIRYAAIDQRYLDFKERGLPVEVPNYVLNDKGRFVQQGVVRLEPYDYLPYTDFLAKEGDATILKIFDTIDPEEYARVMQKDVNAVKDQIRDINQRIEATKEKVASKDSFFVSSDEAIEGRKDAVDDATSFIRLYDQARVREQIEPLREMLDEQRRSFIRSSSIPYMGRHTSLKNEPDPISFSRFSEQEVDLPDLGRIKGIYINELQSDRLRSLREEGPFGGSRIKDFPKLQELETQGQKLKDRWMSLVSNPKASKSSIRDAKEELDTFVSKKLAPFQNRVTQGKYSIKESFAGMENSPQVVQQLMAKNAIRAAIERGDRFVAFPGRESAQPQLYEKLPNNLKQVVKDLGPGFEIRPIELQSSKLGPFTTTAIVWGPEAAARLKKQGVPFKHGGPVDKTTAFIKAHA